MTQNTSAPRSLKWMTVRNSLANVAMPLSAVITGPLLARALGPEGRGAMAALLAPITLFNLMFPLGIPESMIYHVARKRLSRRGVLRLVAVCALVCGGAAMVIGFLVMPAVLSRYEGLQGVFALMLLTLPVTLGFAALRGAVQGLRKFDSVSLERITSAGLRLGLIVALVVTGGLTASAAAWVTILSGAAASLMLVPAFRSGSYEVAGAEANFGKVARFAAGSSLGTVGGMLVLRLDQTLMAPLAGAADLGFYAVAVSLAELPIAAVAAVSDVVFAVAADRDDPNVAARASRVTFTLMVPVCALGCLVAPFAIPLLFGEAFAPAVEMTQILLVATLASAVTAITGAGLMSLGRAGLRSAVQISGALVTVVLLVLLVPPLGGVGASLASLATYLVMALGMLILFSRTSRLPMRASIVPKREDLSLIGDSYRRFRSRRSG